jgi:hypothetical protein
VGAAPVRAAAHPPRRVGSNVAPNDEAYVGIYTDPSPLVVEPLMAPSSRLLALNLRVPVLMRHLADGGQLELFE